MSLPKVLECSIALGRRRLATDKEPTDNGSGPCVAALSPRVSRMARRMALALHIEALVRDGTVANYADVARLGHVSRARVSQIVSLLQLAPDLQEQLLFLPRPVRGREPLPFRQVLAIAALLDWDEQRRRWRKLRRATKTRSRAVS
jgi:hypothetical protein